MDESANTELEPQERPESGSEKELETPARRFRLRRPMIAALTIAAIASLWLGTGLIQQTTSALLTATAPDSALPVKPLPLVRTKVILAEDKRPELLIRGGKIEAERSVIVRAEIGGKTVAVSDQEGQPVSEGDLLCAIALNTREAEQKQAEAMMHLRKLQLQAAKKLAQQGHNTRMSLAQSQANFDTAKAMLARARLAVENTRIIAPFDGILEELFVDQGDVMNPGAACAKIIDMSPLVLSGQVTEEEVAKLQPNLKAWALLPDGSRLDGYIRYIASSADPKTRTFRIEMEAQTPSHIARDGLTVQIHVPLNPVRAHRIDSSILTLNDKGQLGLRIIKIKDGKSIVQFQPIEIVSSNADDFWISGLPEITRIIIVGQEYVSHGTQVAINEDPPSGSLVAPNSDARTQDDQEEQGL